MKIIAIANDGREFNNAEKCAEYENELRRIEKERKEEAMRLQVKRKAEQEAKLEEIRKKDKELRDMMYEYESEYGTHLFQCSDFSLASIGYLMDCCC